MGNERDVALVLSGGAINGVLMEAGFLKRLQESALWPRVGWIFGTSAGALDSLQYAACALGRALYLLRLAADLGYSRPAEIAKVSTAVEELTAYIVRWRAELEEKLDRIDTPALN